MTGTPADYCPDCGTATEVRENGARERRFCPACEQFVWQNPVPVGTVVGRDGAEALFVRRATPTDAGQWDLPGGSPGDYRSGCVGASNPPRIRGLATCRRAVGGTSYQPTASPRSSARSTFPGAVVPQSPRHR